MATEAAALRATSGAALAASCAHCGLRVATALVVPAADRQFCCAGCRAVFGLLQEHGLGRYYALRAETEEAPAPARPSGRSYEELDDPAFQARTCWAAPGGLLATELYLEAVHCSACVWLVERLPRLVPGLVEARLDLPCSRALLRWDPGRARLSAIARALDGLGYPAHPVRGLARQTVRRREDRAMLARIGLSGAAAVNVMAIAFALYGGMLHGMEPEFAALFRWASLAVTLPALVWGGGVFFRGAWGALRARALHMDVPISVGILAGFAHGAVNTVRGAGEVYFDSLAPLIFLLLVGRYLQRRQQRAAADATELLASLQPSHARVVEGGGGIREVPLEALAAGALVEVRAGDAVPADGVVAAGRSALDVSLLSGESRPLAVGPGDRVHAGSTNLAGRIEVRVERTGEETRVGRLLRLVEEHARRRAPVVALADRISGVFVAVVLGLAGLTGALWWHVDPALAVEHAVALLIVTCPCALGLATPLAVSAAVGQAAQAGILVKGADVLERLARPGRMWLDKTGTLSEGRAALVRWAGDDDARSLVAAVETHSAHPLARALVAGLAPAGERPAGPVEVRESPGRGLEARVGPRRVVVGAPAFVAARVGAFPPRWSAEVSALADEGLTPVLVAVDGVMAAAAGLGDPLRPDARGALARVRARGWRVGILSGDHPAVVAAVGRTLGIPAAESRGAVAPEDKARLVAAEAARGPVVMVGDGVNDAAALAAASVGVAVHGGAEAALAAADVFVARPGVGRIADLLDGAARAMRVVRRNLVFSLLYNVVGVGLAASGALSPLIAAIMMPLSSLTVIMSSYRARTFRGAGAAREGSGWR